MQQSPAPPRWRWRGCRSSTGSAKTEQFILQTDRMIVKYKDATPAGKGAAKVPAMSQGRKALVDRAGQQFGLQHEELHTHRDRRPRCSR